MFDATGNGLLAILSVQLTVEYAAAFTNQITHFIEHINIFG